MDHGLAFLGFGSEAEWLRYWTGQPVNVDTITMTQSGKHDVGLAESFLVND